MLFDLVISIFVKVSASIFKWLDQNMLVYILTTAKNFEYVIVFCCAMLFLLITIFVTLRQARKLPTSYIVEVVDVYGQKATPDGLRLVFKTYEAAESYARFYRDIYRDQYRFRVVGVKD
ncbi:MAG TPA: hypothetical protein VFS97_12325 [Nitrososphaeraceae archaeon]|jgi:hypothetical protein|nr:hypothetical protein [Nitrososphaeraceae archaeon]